MFQWLQRNRLKCETLTDDKVMKIVHMTPYQSDVLDFEGEN
jgi:hypothetical protein